MLARLHLSRIDMPRAARRRPDFRGIKERRRKTVALPPELVAVLKALREAQELERTTAGNLWRDHDVVFAQENGRPIDPRSDWQDCSDILVAAGLQHLGVHAMRHSAATIALDEGVALAVVQELLGHSDIRITRAYTNPRELRQTGENLQVAC